MKWLHVIVGLLVLSVGFAETIWYPKGCDSGTALTWDVSVSSLAKGATCYDKNNNNICDFIFGGEFWGTPNPATPQSCAKVEPGARCYVKDASGRLLSGVYTNKFESGTCAICSSGKIIKYVSESAGANIFKSSSICAVECGASSACDGKEPGKSWINKNGVCNYCTSSCTLEQDIPPEINKFDVSVNKKEVEIRWSVRDEGNVKVYIFVGNTQAYVTSSKSGSTTIKFEHSGTYKIKLLVKEDYKDFCGKSKSTEEVKTVTVSNLAPSIEITSPADGQSFVEGNSITVSWKASDPDGDSLSIRLEVINKTSGEVVWSNPYTSSGSVNLELEAGTYEIKAIASDGEASASDSVSIEVLSQDCNPGETSDGCICTSSGWYCAQQECDSVDLDGDGTADYFAVLDQNGLFEWKSADEAKEICEDACSVVGGTWIGSCCEAGEFYIDQANPAIACVDGGINVCTDSSCESIELNGVTYYCYSYAWQNTQEAQEFCSNAPSINAPDFVLTKPGLVNFTVSGSYNSVSCELIEGGSCSIIDYGDGNFSIDARSWQDGEYNVRILVKWGDSQVTYTDISIEIDSTPPTTSVGLSKTRLYTGESLEITCYAYDANFDSAYCEIISPNGVKKSFELENGVEKKISFTPSASGTHRVVLMARDKAGNEKTLESSFYAAPRSSGTSSGGGGTFYGGTSTAYASEFEFEVSRIVDKMLDIEIKPEGVVKSFKVYIDGRLVLESNENFSGRKVFHILLSPELRKDCHSGYVEVNGVRKSFWYRGRASLTYASCRVEDNHAIVSAGIELYCARAVPVSYVIRDLTDYAGTVNVLGIAEINGKVRGTSPVLIVDGKSYKLNCTVAEEKVENTTELVARVVGNRLIVNTQVKVQVLEKGKVVEERVLGAGNYSLDWAKGEVLRIIKDKQVIEFRLPKKAQVTRLGVTPYAFALLLATLAFILLRLV